MNGIRGLRKDVGLQEGGVSRWCWQLPLLQLSVCSVSCWQLNSLQLYMLSNLQSHKADGSAESCNLLSWRCCPCLPVLYGRQLGRSGCCSITSCVASDASWLLTTTSSSATTTSLGSKWLMAAAAAAAAAASKAAAAAPGLLALPSCTHSQCRQGTPWCQEVSYQS
jgi:hypothetical protein